MNIDESKYHLMQSYLENINGESSYVFLAWPKGLSLDGLSHAKEVVNFQLDVFIRSAKRKSDGEIEYESWLRKDQP